MSNTSATGGYLQPTHNSIEGVDFRRFIGSFIAGVSGLDKTMVRPAWQPNPAPMPSITTDWAAFGITAQRAVGDAFMQSADGTKSVANVYEDVDILVTFYGPECLVNAAHFRDGTLIRQNLEVLYSEGVRPRTVGNYDIVHAPELINERWFDRCDLTFTLTREIRREYLILSFVAANGGITANRAVNSLNVDFVVNE